MFTGIVETIGVIERVEKHLTNLNITVRAEFTAELKIDQSVLHNGICLTVVAIEGDSYQVQAIKETIEKTDIGNWKEGDEVNLERAMMLNARLDGHIVQGHVDQKAECVSIEDVSGSVYFGFEYDASLENITIDKGSITIDGVSLTVVDSGISSFKVAIIPYTFEHTIFKHYKVGSEVNLEFDVIGKYVSKLAKLR